MSGWRVLPPLTEEDSRGATWHLSSNTGVISIYIHRLCSVLSSENNWRPLPSVFHLEIFLFCFCMKIFLLPVKQKPPRGLHCIVQLPPQVKYLQFVESIAQCGVHLRWPYDLQIAGETTFMSFQHGNKTQSVMAFLSVMCSPWKIWITRLVSKVLSIALLSALLAVSISTVRMFTLWQGWRGRVIRSQQGTTGCDRRYNVKERLTDAAVGDNSVSVITFLPCGNLHDPITTVTFIVGRIFHGLERCQLEWKSLL